MSDRDAAQPASTDGIERDLARTRAELADTVDALSDKLNVKKRVDEVKADARLAVHNAGEQAKMFGQDLVHDKPRLGIVVCAVVLAVAGIAMLRRRRY